MENILKFFALALVMVCALALPSCTDKNPENCKHEFGEWETVREATCKEEGEKTRECSECKKTEAKKISKTEHDYGDWVESKTASCISSGEKTRSCSVCNKKESETIAALGHSFGSYKIIKAADCENSGTRSKTCSNCNETVTESYAALGHNYQGSDAVCSLCGDLKNGTVGLAFDYHSTGEFAGTYSVRSIGTAIYATQIIIPSTYNGKPVSYIDEDAFAGYEIVSVTIPASVRKIYSSAFYGCEQLETVTFKKGSLLETFTGFGRCTSLRSITIPANVKTIESIALRGCTSLENVYFENTTGWYTRYGNTPGGSEASVTDASTNANIMKNYSNNTVFFRIDTEE